MIFEKRDTYPFFTVHMPHLSSNMPSTILYWSIFSELLRIARCTLNRINDLIPIASDLFSKMIVQGGIICKVFMLPSPILVEFQPEI